jgi:hypothetical protein
MILAQNSKRLDSVFCGNNVKTPRAEQCHQALPRSPLMHGNENAAEISDILPAIARRILPHATWLRKSVKLWNFRPAGPGHADKKVTRPVDLGID